MQYLILVGYKNTAYIPKDLCVAGIIDRSELFEVAAKMFDTMQDGFTEEE